MIDLFETYEDFVARLLAAKTEDEVIACRAALRPWCEGNALRLVMWGYRQPRKRRAGTDHGQRRPTAEHLRQAREMLRQGRRSQEIEAFFADTYNVRVSRNRLSKMCGARP